MTEIPEHLLARSRARRSALGGGGGDDAPAPEAPSAAPATTGDAAPTPAAKAPATAPAVVEAPPPPPYVQAALDRKKIPWWAATLMAFLPLWGVVYVGTLSSSGGGEVTQLVEGGEIYAASCASCHGATGGGGVGPAMTGGAVIETFPNRADMMLWIYGGSTGWPGTTYGANGKAKAGGMPGFAETLTPEELLAVVRYEREVLGGEEISADSGEALGENEELLVTDESGAQVDALAHYFGEGAEAGEYTVSGGQPSITGAEFSGGG